MKKGMRALLLLTLCPPLAARTIDGKACTFDASGCWTA